MTGVGLSCCSAPSPSFILEIKSLVLASEEDGSSLDALKFSLASDIVELVVLSADEVFLQTLREAVGEDRRLWHVMSSDKVSDLLIAGEVGIVVLDLQALSESANVFIGQIKRQFPDLVIVVAGTREDETALAGLISAGIVYRFIHKPMSPGRAKLFAEAAVRKYGEQRRRTVRTPAPVPSSGTSRLWLIGAGVAAALVLIAIVAFVLHQNGSEEAKPSTETPVAATPGKPLDSPLLAKAATALAANRLTEPRGDNALELYLQAQARNPADPAARAGLAEVRERLLARAENSLLEERLDEAAAAIETARKSGVESGRIAYLSAQLAKLRELVKAAQTRAAAQTPTQSRATTEARPDDDKVKGLLVLEAQKLDAGHLLEPMDDNARYYLLLAQRLDASNIDVLEAKRVLSARLLTEARGAIDRRDFAAATTWIEGANGVAAPANLETLQSLLTLAHNQADTDAWNQMLNNARERLQQDRLIEPATDNAKYYLLTLQKLNPGNAGLGPALQDLGVRLVAKARRALALEQLDAARSWLEEASSIGFSSEEATGVQRDLDAAVAKSALASAVVPAAQLHVLKSVEPIYPSRALAGKIEGWVELNFEVTDKGAVRDVVVKAASNPGVFDDAAIKAVSQWRYQPVVRDGKPVSVHSIVRIRFART
jgi:TonB family protein